MIDKEVRTLLDRMKTLCGRSFPGVVTVEILPPQEHQVRWRSGVAAEGWGRWGVASARNLVFMGFPVPTDPGRPWWQVPLAPEVFWDRSTHTLLVQKDLEDDPRVRELAMVSALRAAWQDLAGWSRKLVPWPSHEGLGRDMLQWGDRVMMLALYGGRYTVWPCTPDLWVKDEDHTAMLALLPHADWPVARQGLRLVQERLEWPYSAGLSCLLPLAAKKGQWGRWMDAWEKEGAGWKKLALKVWKQGGEVPGLKGFEGSSGDLIQRDSMGPWWLERWLGVPVVEPELWRGDAYLIRQTGTGWTACGEVLWKDAAAGWNACSALERVWSERLKMVFKRGGRGGLVRAGAGMGRYGLLQVRGAVLRWILTEDRKEANRWMRKGSLMQEAPGLSENGPGPGEKKTARPEAEN